MTLSILFDAYWLVDGPPSGRNMLRSLIPAWAETFPEDLLTLAVPELGAATPPLGDLGAVNVIEVPKFSGEVHGSWVALHLGKRASKFDAVITQNFTPLGPHSSRRDWKGPVKATFVHDVLFAEHKEWFSRAERAYLSGIALGVRRTDLILTSSVSEQRRIIRTWRHQAEKVRSIGLAVPRDLQGAKRTKPTTNVVGARPFILSVGRLNIRKNLGRLIHAYASSEKLQATCDLVIVGAADGLDALPSAQKIPETVRFLGSVTDGELAWLYANCELFAFPSLDEGFGLPLIEAQFFGTAIAASNIDVFRELDAADAYFDPRSVGDIRRVLESVAGRGQLERENTQREIPHWNGVASRARRAIMEVRSQK